VGLFERLRTEPLYNTRAVVQRTGVPADTFRAWERRYGLPSPARTDGNQRLYSERDVATISWLRDQTRAGLTASQAVRLFHSGDSSDVPAPAMNAPPRVPAGPSTPDRMCGFRDAMVEALVAYDAIGAALVVEESLALLSVEDVCLHVLQPALYEIGDRWSRGLIGISAEHFASSFVIRRLGALFNLSQPEHGRGPIVATCLEGELHEVGLLLTCLFLSRRGFRVLYLGPNLPLDDLIETIAQLRPPLVLLSASTPPSALQLAAASRQLRHLPDSMGEAPAIGYGGHVFVDHPELRDGIDGVFLGQNADEAAAAVDRILGPAAAV
jgi:MerR family transcriptional regulator, light-induced transcriptional regulator